MTLSAEWRSDGESDIIVVLDGETACAELAADAGTLSDLLTGMRGLETWRREYATDRSRRDPAAWGQLVIRRASTGEILVMEPQLFWEGVYRWFRSRGVDYDSPQ